MIGDSITNDGRWWTLALAHHLARRPGRAPAWCNLGIPGDSAAGALARFDDDIAPQRPTAAVVMLGMNDVERDLYGPDRHGEAWHRRRLAALDRHRVCLARLVARLRAIGVGRLILCTPTPYDDEAAVVCPNLRGVGAALTACGGWVRELASAHGAEVLDFNGPLRSENRRQLTMDPGATIIGPDRVHPGWPGHALMAGLLVEHLGLGEPWLDLDVDALPAASGWRAEGLVRTPDRVAFTLTGGGVVPPLAHLGIAGIPWLDRPSLTGSARLVIGGLAAGRWTLTVDGRPVGTWDAAEWSAGIDPTAGPGPWHGHGARILDAALAWLAAGHPARRRRMLAGWAGCPPDDLARLRRTVAAWRDGDPSMPAWLRPMIGGDWLMATLRTVDADAAQPERSRADRIAAWDRLLEAARPLAMACGLARA